jgi:hypothetical protein
MKTLMISSLLFMFGGYLVTINALDTRGNAGSEPSPVYYGDTIPKKDTMKRRYPDSMRRKMPDTTNRRKRDTARVN